MTNRCTEMVTHSNVSGYPMFDPGKPVSESRISFTALF